jgi:hypothetical protein
LLALTGLLGAHRFYLHRWLSGAAYVLVLFAGLILFEPLALIPLVIGLVVDAYLLPRMTAEANETIAAAFEKNPQRFHHEASAQIAPWALEEKTGFWYAIRGPARVFTFIFFPVAYTLLMVESGNYEFIVFPVIILLATGLVTSLDDIARRHPTLLELPGIEDALDQVKAMKTWYWHNEPLLRAPFLRVFTRATTEFRPYWNIVGLMVLAILVDLAFSWGDDYGDYLNISNAWWIVLLHVFINAYAVLIFLSQLSALSFHYSLSGKRIRLRILTLVALAMTGLSFYLFVDISDDPGQVSLLSSERLALRMQDREFQQALVDNSSMFILYYESPLFAPPEDPVADDPMLCGNVLTRNECPPTEWLRELLNGLAPNDESQAFEVFDGWLPEGESASAWRGVRYQALTGRVVVAAWNGELLCQNFQDTPPEADDPCATVLQAFTVFEDDPPLN